MTIYWNLYALLLFVFLYICKIVLQKAYFELAKRRTEVTNALTINQPTNNDGRINHYESESSVGVKIPDNIASIVKRREYGIYEDEEWEHDEEVQKITSDFVRRRVGIYEDGEHSDEFNMFPVVGENKVDKSEEYRNKKFKKSSNKKSISTALTNCKNSDNHGDSLSKLSLEKTEEQKASASRVIHHDGMEEMNLESFLNIKYLWSGCDKQFDKYLSKIGITDYIRKTAAKKAKVEEILMKEDDQTYTLRSTVFCNNCQLQFRLGEEFKYTTMDGRKVTSTMTRDGNVLNEVQVWKDSKDQQKTAYIRREYNQDQLTSTLTVDDVTTVTTSKATKTLDRANTLKKHN